MSTSNAKTIAKAVLAELAPGLTALVKAEIAAHLPAGIAPVAAVVVEATEKAFEANNPGVGGPAPVNADDATTDSRLDALEAKVDALVQATGHGNSAAMGAHL